MNPPTYDPWVVVRHQVYNPTSPRHLWWTQWHLEKTGWVLKRVVAIYGTLWPWNHGEHHGSRYPNVEKPFDCLRWCRLFPEREIQLFGNLVGIRIYNWLVVWNMNYIFHFIYGIIIPTGELIFFKTVETTKQYQVMDVRQSPTFRCTQDSPQGEKGPSTRTVRDPSSRMNH